MRRTWTLLFLAAAALALAEGCLPPDEPELRPEKQPWAVGSGFGAPPPRRPVPQKVYAMAEVRRHDRESDCWLVIWGRVYDVTAFIPFHPGGDAILNGCGRDATRLFETRPMGTMTPHSAAARQTASQYLAGTVKETEAIGGKR